MSGEPYEPGGIEEAEELMELTTIFHEWETGKTSTDADAPEGFINPAAMDAWAADSIEAREAMKDGAFE